MQAYDGTSQRASTLAVYKSATVASGVAVFHLTSDGTAAGTALFPSGPNLDSVNLVPNDSAASYQMSWVWSNSNKTLTATVNKSVSTGLITLLGISVLGAPAVANGATIRLQVTG